MREQRWELKYAVLKPDGEAVKRCVFKSEAQKNNEISVCKERGYRVISCKKLYPFNVERNAHNFELVYNVCRNRTDDMLMGNVRYDEAEYNRLTALGNRADRCRYWALSRRTSYDEIIWLPWDEWKECKEISDIAVLHRQNKCIEAGRLDLLQYC